MEIIVKSNNVQQETTQKGNVILKQQAAIDIGRDYPLVFDMTVKAPYPPGRYTIAPGSYRVNQWGSLELSAYDLQLLPVKQ